MNRTFDYLGNVELPSFTLCNPNGKQIAIMSHSKNRLLKYRIGGFSELTFDVDYKIDGIVVPYYNKIEARREVLVDGYGLFIIESFDEFNDGFRRYKSVTCKSKDAEFATKSLVAYTGSKKLFSMTSSDTILGKLIEYFPKWKVDYVSSTLYEEERMYDVSEQNWYDFLMTNVQEDFNCVFVFDTINKTIRVLNMNELRNKTDIYISFENLLKSINITPPAQNVVTAMDVYGGDGLDISTVNLTGNTLYNYSNYKTIDWINQDTINAITRWETKINTDNVAFSQLFTSLKTATGELITLQVEEAELNAQLKALNDVKGVRVSEGVNYSDIEEQIIAKEAEISSKVTAISNKKASIENTKSQMKALQDGVKMEMFFTATQLRDLDSITFKSVYQNDCFIKSSIMTDQEVQEQSERLMKLAREILDSRLSKLCYTFTSEVINFATLKEFEPFAKQLELGAEFTLDVNGDIFNPILLQMDIAFDDVKTSTFTFCTDVRMSTDGLDFANLFNGFKATISDVDYNKGLMKDYIDSGDKHHFDSMKNDALNLTLKDIIASDGQDFVISSYGIRGKREGSKNEVWMTNNCIAFSNNNFKPDSAKLALGEVTVDGVKAFGLIADVLVGDVIFTKTLKATNTNGSFLVDGSRVKITNGEFLMTVSGEDKDIMDIISSGDAKVANDLSSAIGDINDSMGDMQKAIEDGMIEIFYQDTIPLIPPAKQGDMWYDTTVINGIKKNESWLCVSNNGVLSWEKIKDSEITKALSDAQSAQTTADGKITSYYQSEAPIGTQDKPLCEGDLWIDTDDNNYVYVYKNGWVSASSNVGVNMVVNSLPEKLETRGWAFDSECGTYTRPSDNLNYFYAKYPTTIQKRSITSKVYSCEPNTEYTISFNYSSFGENNCNVKILGSTNKKDTNIVDTSYEEVLLNSNIISSVDGRKLFTFKTNASTLSFFIMFDANNVKGLGGEMWLHRIKVEKGKHATQYTKAPNENEFFGVSNITNKVDGVLTAGGLLDTEKLQGQILAGKNNIMCVDDTNLKALKMNEAGILIANKKNGTEWAWSTAISADGIVAEHIKSGGTIYGCNLSGGTLNIGNANFTVDSSGYCEAKNIKVIGGQIQGGSLLGTSININDKFTVNSLGVCTATNIIITGSNGSAKLRNAEIIGGRIEQVSGTGEGFLLEDGYMYVHGLQSALAGVIYHTYEDAKTKMWVQGIQALKLSCQKGGISLEPSTGSKVWIGDCAFTGSVSGCKVVFG